jgi:HEAT repeat protein
MPRRLLAVALLLLAALAAPARASIAPPPPPHVLYARAEVVCVGRVESVGPGTIHVVVTKALKGEAKEIDVGPIVEPRCCPPRDGEKVEPAFKVGERVFVVAAGDSGRLHFLDHTLWSARLKDEAAEARALAFAAEMLRVVALPEHDRAEAMIAELWTEDAALVSAAQSFQFDELDTPQKARPHAPSLVRALDAPGAMPRIVAMRALVGVGAPEAFDRLLDLSRSRNSDEATAACAALACYDREEAVEAILDASDGCIWRLGALGTSPRPEARKPLVKLLRSGDPATRRVAYSAFGARAAAFGAMDADADELLAALRRDVAREEMHDLGRTLAGTRSFRVAEALVALVGDDDTTVEQRDAAYIALWSMASQLKMTDVAGLLRREEKVFERRLDEGPIELHLCWILGVIHTDAARAALERAQKLDPPDRNGDAWRTLLTWNER